MLKVSSILNIILTTGLQGRMLTTISKERNWGSGRLITLLRSRQSWASSSLWFPGRGWTADLLFFMFLKFTLMGSKNRNIEIGVWKGIPHPSHCSCLNFQVGNGKLTMCVFVYGDQLFRFYIRDVRASSVASVRSNSLQPCGLKPTRLLCPWDSPGKNTGVGCHFLLQGIFLTQGLNQSL